MYHFRLSAAASCLSVTLLAACGGSGGQSFEDRLQGGIPRDYIRLVDTKSYSNLAQLPQSGYADYSGVLLTTFEKAQQADVVALADLKMRVNYATNDITGAATNFVGQDVGAIAGNLTLDAALNRAANNTSNFPVSGTLNGALNIPRRGAAQVTSQVQGSIYGADNVLISGAAKGTAVFSSGNETFTGSFFVDNPN